MHGKEWFTIQVFTMLAGWMAVAGRPEAAAADFSGAAAHWTFHHCHCAEIGAFRSVPMAVRAGTKTKEKLYSRFSRFRRLMARE
jgi:hypothetical protein